MPALVPTLASALRLPAPKPPPIVMVGPVPTIHGFGRTESDAVAIALYARHPLTLSLSPDGGEGMVGIVAGPPLPARGERVGVRGG